MNYLLIGSVFFALVTLFVIYKSFSSSIRNAQLDIINALQNGVIILNKKGKIIYCNAILEKLMNISSKNILGKAIDTTLPLFEKAEPLTFQSYKQPLMQIQDKIVKYRKDDGSEVSFSLTISKISFAGDTSNTLILFENLSQEKELEEMKVDFVSMAAHELRTPLTAIRGYSSLLQLHYATNLSEQAKELLTRLIVSTTNLANLIDNLLSVSRIERNNMTIEAKPLDIGVIVKDIFESFRQQARTKRQQYTLTLPETLPLVMVDPFRIGQVFINLISNAINYTPEGGTITVIVEVKEQNLEIIIQDTGEGIPQEALPRLFTKFFRVSGSLEQGSKGTGLGLYITKSIIEMHKGKIWAESTLNKGSKFTCTIPIASKDEITNQMQLINNAFLTAKNGQAIIIKKSSIPASGQDAEHGTISPQTNEKDTHS